MIADGGTYMKGVKKIKADRNEACALLTL